MLPIDGASHNEENNYCRPIHGPSKRSQETNNLMNPNTHWKEFNTNICTCNEWVEGTRLVRSKKNLFVMCSNRAYLEW